MQWIGSYACIFIYYIYIGEAFINIDCNETLHYKEHIQIWSTWSEAFDTVICVLIEFNSENDAIRSWRAYLLVMSEISLLTFEFGIPGKWTTTLAGRAA